ncbi:MULTISPECIES: hypothetical protein [Methylococcus]|uniref:hypothetical protein n=1 Tax=Methylococcus TaxID=413 RepID=UPI0002FAE9BA|nr:hypothetical protein [Methylococcus capsulatus]QXP93023.1 hypothetical protein KW113_11720 [Methylococcus capsulatus]
MTGWKTKTAAIVSVAYGLLGWLLGLHGADIAMQFIVQGIGIAGVGHKIEKAATPAPLPQGRGEDMSDEEFAAFVRRQQK